VEMLNISENSLYNHITNEEISLYKSLDKKNKSKLLLFISLTVLLVIILGLFLPWTQNIDAKGYVTTINPSQQPQSIQSVISGRLESWYVQEGDFVNEGDTIVFISEVKSEYFDPNLVERTNEQVNANIESIQSYEEKVKSIELQQKAMIQNRDLKIETTKNKIIQIRREIVSDSIDLAAYELMLDVANKQYDRTKELYEKGIKSKTDLETKSVKQREMTSKVVVQKNKLDNQTNKLLNLELELSSIKAEYADKIAKSESDKFSAISSKLDTRAKAAKLKNSLSNYEVRQKYYYITAPQSGYITKAIKKGIGEIIKEGTDIVTIMPKSFDLAIEIYVKPMDLPLIFKEEKTRIQFDGWPAVVFSGWPNISTGTYGGVVVAVDRIISKNGLYRVLIAPNDDGKKWPDVLRVGSGAKAFVLLRDVPLWYELWRQLNGFPPDFYSKEDA
jgi:multidrug resistance efflux pump